MAGSVLGGHGYVVEFIDLCTPLFLIPGEMMEALQPWNLRIIGRNGSEPGAFGDGIKACLWAGAKMDETHSMMMFDRCALPSSMRPGSMPFSITWNGILGSAPFSNGYRREQPCILNCWA